MATRKAMVPAGCPEEMANELRRCVNELGFKAAHLVSYTPERTIDDPVFYPYYEAAQVPSVFGQDARLIDAAKREGGKVVVYGSLESDTVEPINRAFQKKTGIRVEYWRASATKVMDRALSEYRAGKPLFDVMLNNSGAMHVMLKEGVFAKYDSPSAKEFRRELLHPDLGPKYRGTPIGIMYHKGIVKPSDAPKSLEDLVHPKYRGKGCRQNPAG